MLAVRLVVITALVAAAVIFGFNTLTGTTSEDVDKYELTVEFKPTRRSSDVIIELAIGVAPAKEHARAKQSPYRDTITSPRGIRVTLYATQNVQGELIVSVLNLRTRSQGTGRRTSVGKVGCTV